MDHKIDPQKALIVFDKITRFGEKRGERYHLSGLQAQQSFDGYSVTLSDEKVSLTINFHNTFQLDAPDNIALETFISKLDNIHSATFN